MKKAGLLLVVLVGLLLLLWSPWLSAEAAQERAVAAFTSAWSGVDDGCGFNCTGCGAVSARRTLLGWQVDVEYACGLLPADVPEYHRRATLFVSVLGTVHGLGAR